MADTDIAYATDTVKERASKIWRLMGFVNDRLGQTKTLEHVLSVYRELDTAAQSQSITGDDKLAFQTALANGLMNKATDYSMSLDDHAKMQIAFQAGRDSKGGKSQSGWVKIEDIPEEWNDKKLLLGCFADCSKYGHLAYSKKNERYGWQYKFNDSWPCTHAMLPPQPPEGG